MVFTIEEIMEKSRQDASGVSFEEALKKTRESNQIENFQGQTNFLVSHRFRQVPLLPHLHIWRVHGERIFRDDGHQLRSSGGRMRLEHHQQAAVWDHQRRLVCW